MGLAERKSSPVKATPISGFFGGILGGIVGLGIGFVLCLVFLPLGIIVIVASLVMPLAGLVSKSSSCPNCGKGLTLTSNKIKCPDCKHRLVIRNGRLLDVT